MKDFFIKLWEFIKSKLFLINFAGMIAVSFLCFVFLTTWLKCYTNHGDKIVMPDFTNMTVKQASKIANNNSLKLKVIDSVYLIDKLPGIILNQDPMSGEEVKENRTVYLTATKEIADDVLLPTLSGNDNFDRYERLLRRYAIKAIVKERIVHDKYQENTILHFYYNGEKVDEEDLIKGFKVPKGSELEFVVTEKISTIVEMPDLICRSFADAKLAIHSHQLKLGNISTKGDVPNMENAYIYKQEPSHYAGKMIQTGDSIHLFIIQSQPEKCKDLIYD